MAHKPAEKYQVELKEVAIETSAIFKKIGCPSCGQDVPASNLNINDKIAKCGNCDVVFSFQEEVSDLASPTAPKQEILRPEGIDLFHYQGELDISMEQPVTIPEVLLGIFIPLFAIIFTFAYFASSQEFPLFLPLSTGTLAFLALFNLINRSKQKLYLHLDDRYLSIKRRPKKFIKDREYSIADIDQLYVKGVNAQYFVYMIVDTPLGQKHVQLISSLPSLSKARYLEQEIEKQLRIQDRKIPEEIIS